MLQAFTHEGCATGSCAEQKSARTCVGCLPDEITNTLKTKHGIKRVEGNHWHATRRITCASRDKARHAASLRNAFFENLA